MSKTVNKPTARPALLSLKCAVQNYDWGDPRFIPRLLELKNPGQNPFAELWMGAHPGAPSKAVVEGKEIGLDELLRRDRSSLLGPEIAGRYGGRLPFLFKVLSAAKPLSIQTHPTKPQAEEGFARENAAGKNLKAPDRNYKDDNHKPELICALTDFYALRGFRPLEEISDLLKSTPEFLPFRETFVETRESLKNLYSRWMSLPPEEADRVLSPLIDRLRKQEGKRPFKRHQREYWVLSSDRLFSKEGHQDRGLFSIFLLNLVRLKPGQAMYLGAGELHAYLEGSGMEIMANSDNVLRGGLTPKHVDVPELLRTLTFDSGKPALINGEKASRVETVYPTPAAEFQLSRLDLSKGKEFKARARGPECFIVLKGDLSLRSAHGTVDAGKGGVFFAPDGASYVLRARLKSRVFRAAVPPLTLRNALACVFHTNLTHRSTPS